MATDTRDLLTSFDYFAVHGLSERGTHGQLSVRDTRVVQWAWAWPDLAPHVMRLLYDAEHHVRCEPNGDASAVMDGRTGEWTAVSALRPARFTPSLIAFEAAIVFHAVIRPDGSPLVVTFYRGDDTYVVSGVERCEEPSLPEEVCVTEFPCNDQRSLRVKKWLLGQLAADTDVTENTTVPGGASISADGETVVDVMGSLQCDTCAFMFNSRDHLEFHRRASRFCRRTPISDNNCNRNQFQVETVAYVSFRVQKQHLMEDLNPIPGSPVRVCWHGVPIFVMNASEWMWCREEIAAIRHSAPFHRCYRVAELPFVVFDSRSPCVPQLSACLEDVWTVNDALALLETAADLCADAPQFFCLLTEHEDLLRRSRFACVVAGPHVGEHDAFLHISMLNFTSRGTMVTRVYLHRRAAGNGTDAAVYMAVPNLPIDEVGNIVSMRSSQECQLPVVFPGYPGGGLGVVATSAGMNSGRSTTSDTNSIDCHDVCEFRQMATTVNPLPGARNDLPSEIPKGGDADLDIEEEPFFLTKVGDPPSHLLTAANLVAHCAMMDRGAKIDPVQVLLTSAAEAAAPSIRRTEKCNFHFPPLVDAEEADEEVDTSMDSGTVAAEDERGDVGNLVCTAITPRTAASLNETSESNSASVGNGGHATATLRPFSQALGDVCSSYIYVENLGRHIEQHHFVQDDAHRRALLQGSGRICCNPDAGRRLLSDAAPKQPCLCGALHPVAGFPNRLCVRLPDVDHQPDESRRFVPCDSVLVLDLRENISVDLFFANSGLQHATRFGRGKLCRLGPACPSPRVCWFLHADEQVTKPLRKLRSIYVRNICTRLNASQFVQNRGLHRALSVGEGYVCTGHESLPICTRLHFDHFRVLDLLKNCPTIERLVLFAATHGLGQIVTRLRGVHASASRETLERERTKVDVAYRTQYRMQYAIQGVEEQRHALEMKRRLYAGVDHPELAGSLNKLGSSLAAMGDRTGAAALQREALDMMRRLYANVDHPNLASSLSNVANSMGAMGDRAAAVALQREAVDMKRRLYAGVDHPDLAASLNNLGSSLAVMGDNLGSVAFQREALEMLLRLYGGGEHSYLASSLSDVATPLTVMGKHTSRVTLQGEAMEIKRQRYAGSDHPDLAASLNNVGNSLAAMGDCSTGGALQREALDMRRRLYAGVDHPDLAASLSNVGKSLEAMGDHKAGMALHREALAMMRRLYTGVDHPRLAGALSNLATTLKALGDGAAAAALQHEALDMRRRLYAGVDHPDLAASLTDVGHSLEAMGSRRAGVSLQREAVDMRRRLFAGVDHPDLAVSLNNLGNSLAAMGDRVGAVSLQREAVEMMRRLYAGVNHKNRASSVDNLGTSPTALGDGVALQREALEKRRRLGVDHPHLAASLNNLGNSLAAMGDRVGGVTLQREAVEMMRRLYAGVDHPDLAGALNNLGNCLAAMGDRTASTALQREAVEMMRRLCAGVDHSTLAASLHNLGNSLVAIGDRTGVPFLREALAMRRRLHAGVDHPDLAASLNNVGNSLAAMGDRTAGVALQREALEMLRRVYAGADHPELAASLSNVGNSLAAVGDRTAAVALQREALEMRRRLYAGVDHSDLAASISNVGNLLATMGDRTGGVALQREALEMLRRLYAGADHPELAASLSNVGNSLAAVGDRTAAVALQREALEMRRRLYAGVDHPDLAASLNNVGISLETLGDHAAAVTLQREALEIRRRLYVASAGTFPNSVDVARMEKIRRLHAVDRPEVDRRLETIDNREALIVQREAMEA